MEFFLDFFLLETNQKTELDVLPELNFETLTLLPILHPTMQTLSPCSGTVQLILVLFPTE